MYCNSFSLRVKLSIYSYRQNFASALSPRLSPPAPPVSGPLTGTACVQTLKDKQLKLTKLESLLVANRHVFLNPFKTSQDFYLFC